MPRIKGWTGWAPSGGAVRGSLFHASPLASCGFLAVSGVPWLDSLENQNPDFCLHLSLFLCLSTQFYLCVYQYLCPNFSFNQNTSHFRLGLTLITSF